MCNEYEFQLKYDEYVEMMRYEDIGTPSGETAANMPQVASVRIGDTAPILRAAGNVIELAPMKFGLPPPRPRAGPVFNFRSEGRSFDKSNRCLIPASAFFEFTGSKYPKAKHRFTMADAPMLAIAGLWRDGDEGESFTMLTTEPGHDVAPYHDRQIVILQPRDWAAWIYLTKPEVELLKPLPAGSLTVETVRPGSDNLLV
jgi:putative SOS response-associated peptidase YedK